MDELMRKRLYGDTAAAVRPPQASKQEQEQGELIDRVRQQLFARVEASVLGRRDSEAQRILRQVVTEIVGREGVRPLDRPRVISEILNDVLGFGPIQPLIEDPEVTEIMVNGPNRVYVERGGRLEKSDICFRDEEHVRNVIQKIVGPVGRRIDESSPTVDARLPDGSRVNAVIPPLALDGSCITIRKFGRRLSADDLLRLGTLGRRELELLRDLVRGKLNVLVSGGTGSGKTTLLNVLSSFIPHDERIVTIEDAAELQLQQEHVVRLEARPPNIEGKGEISIRHLVRNALRMRPDRIIVGECRGGEALDMLQAMNTGHDGSLTTLHANSPRDAVSRLETLVLMAGEDLPLRAIREQIASAIDLIVQIARIRDGSRRVTRICEVGKVLPDGSVEVRYIFVFDFHGADTTGRVIGELVPTGLVPAFLEKLAWRGISVQDQLFCKELR